MNVTDEIVEKVARAYVAANGLRYDYDPEVQFGINRAQYMEDFREALEAALSTAERASDEGAVDYDAAIEEMIADPHWKQKNIGDYGLSYILNCVRDRAKRKASDRPHPPQATVRPVIDATESMTDSVRYLFVGMEQPGQTFGGIRKHCALSGMDTSHWPVWMKDRDFEHFNKSARAALVWHCMQQANGVVGQENGA